MGKSKPCERTVIVMISSFARSYRGLLEVLIKPVEVGALPEQGILRLEHPVIFVWVDKKLSGDASELCSVEGGHSLSSEDAVVTLAVDD